MISSIFLIFIIYSFIGWLWETLLIAVRDRKFVNRGFLFGPICPIYGCGAILCSIVLFGRVSNPGLLFVIGAVLCTSLEFATHWALEKLFHARWWDYSDEKFNLAGRICLKSAIAFGFCILVLIDFLHPFLLLRVSSLPRRVLWITALIIYSVFIADISLTVTGLIGLKEKLASLQEVFAENMQRGIDMTEEKRLALIDKIESSQLFRERLQKLTLPSISTRLISNFPRLSSERYKEALERAREMLSKK